MECSADPLSDVPDSTSSDSSGTTPRSCRKPTEVLVNGSRRSGTYAAQALCDNRRQQAATRRTCRIRLTGDVAQHRAFTAIGLWHVGGGASLRVNRLKLQEHPEEPLISFLSTQSSPFPLRIAMASESPSARCFAATRRQHRREPRHQGYSVSRYSSYIIRRAHKHMAISTSKILERCS